MLCIIAMGGMTACSDDNGNKGEVSPETQKDAGVDAGHGEEAIDTEEILLNEQAEEILAGMTLENKIAQMIQGQFEDMDTTRLGNLCVGSVFNGGEEPVLPNEPDNWAEAIDARQEAIIGGCGIPFMYGLDAVHGNAKVIGSTVFPHNIGLGAAGDPELVAKVGQATGRECRGVGIHLTFAPGVSVVRDERWGRTYEGFGETSEINAEMGAAYVRGLQGMGDLSDPGAVAATAKHYVGDGGTLDGVNSALNTFGEETMRTIHLPPYEAAMAEGLAAIMPSYHRWERDGEAYPITVDGYTLRGILKEELGFKGFCLSDYDAIPQAFGLSLATYNEEDVSAAISAGIDMAMISPAPGIDGFIEAIKSGLTNGTIYQEWVDDSVRRILRVKVKMGLFDNPYSNAELRAQIGSNAHRELAREAARKSLVLLKNVNSALPLHAEETVAVVGSAADMMGKQAGGWTVGWQGDAGYTTAQVMGETIRAGLEVVGGQNVMWDRMGENLAGADKVVVVLGESPYAEGWGDHGNNGNSVYIEDLDDYELLTAAIASGKSVIFVLISGRPMIISPVVLEGIDAFVAAWLPGSRGIGVADVLYGGAHNFTGMLPHTWPAAFDQIPVNVDKQADEPGYDAKEVLPLYPYGHGLSY
jgi:beta-glucosidase